MTGQVLVRRRDVSRAFASATAPLKMSPGSLVLMLTYLVSLLLSGSIGATGLGVSVTDRVTTVRGVAVPVSVLGNDLDFRGVTTVTITGSPTNGGVVVSGSPGSSGSVLATYTPNPGFSGTDSFTYQASDGTSTGSATVQVTVLADSDADGVADLQDNCQGVSNAGQCDSDNDGYGNHCDGDLNNNGAVNAQDTTLFRQQLGQPSVAPGYNKADISRCPAWPRPRSGSGTVYPVTGYRSVA